MKGFITIKYPDGEGPSGPSTPREFSRQERQLLRGIYRMLNRVTQSEKFVAVVPNNPRYAQIMEDFKRIEAMPTEDEKFLAISDMGKETRKALMEFVLANIELAIE